MPKAARVLAALKRDGWVEERRHGSHRILRKGTARGLWTHHDGADLGKDQITQVAREFGYTVDELRRL
jgi:predicted RNA binding protein YcfA (HicA-like mRNA interferase family)